MTTLNKSQIEQVMTQAGFAPGTLDIGSAIALAESGGRSDAIGPVGEVGLFQIYLTAHPQYSRTAMLDPLQNAKAAFAISSHGSSWRPWCTAYSDGACGTRGGAYLGNGSPYRKFLGTSTVPPQPGTPQVATGLPGAIFSSNVTFVPGAIISSGTKVFNDIASTAHQTLNTVPGFVGIVDAIDEIEQFQPMKMPATVTGAPDWSILGLAVTNPIAAISELTLPANTMQAFLMFVTANIAAAFIRLILIFVGLIIIISLVQNMLNSTITLSDFITA